MMTKNIELSFKIQHPNNTITTNNILMLTFCMCEGSNVEELEESTMTLRDKMHCNKKHKTLIINPEVS